MPAEAIIQSNKAWLRSTWHIEVPRSWLYACVEWVLEEAGGTDVPQTQLNQQVLDQWLLTDLRDLAYPVLPEGVSEAEKAELNGFYCLQMDSLLDVSQPAYGQLQRVRGTDCTNEEVTAVTQATQKPWEAKPTRMLMLQLTDGVQSLEGMEYQPIPALSTSLPPGTKLQLVGRVVVRLGVLLLKPENVRVLGGEVEQLVERHAQRRVLCRALGLPQEDQVQEAEPDDLELLASIEAVGEPQERGPARGSLDSGYGGSLDSQASIRMDPPNGHQFETSRLNPSFRATSDPQQRNQNVVDIPDEDFNEISDNFDYAPENFDEFPDPDHNNAPEDFDDIPVEELEGMMSPTDEELLPSDEAMEYNTSEPQAVPTPKPVNFNKASSQERLINYTSTKGPNHLSTPKTILPVGSAGEAAGTVSSDDSFSPQPKMARYEPVSSSAHTRADVSAQEHSSKAKADTSILNYLCILQSGVWPPPSAQTVRLQAFIVTLLGSLRSSGGEWKVSATISDGTGYLDVDLSDALLTKLIGFSASESRALRKDPAKRPMVDAGLQNCQKELVDMCCVMNVRLDATGRGVVLKTDPLTDRECCELERRVKERRS